MAETTADTAVLQALYDALSETGRRRLMRSVITDVRREQLKRIAAQKNPDGSRFAPRAKAQQGRRDQRQGPLFPRLRLIRHTVIQSTEADALLGFKTRTERIARVHQFGEMDAPRKGWRPVRYPVRQLLGVSDRTESVVWESLERHLLK